MLANAMFLAIISVILEMFLVTKNPQIRHFFNRHEIIGLTFSFGLSVALGIIFGAQGLIAMMGGICSTVMTTMIYKTHLLEYYDKFQKNRSTYSAKYHETKDLLIRSIHFWWSVFTAPVRFIQWVKSKIEGAKRAILGAKRRVLHT